MSDAQPAIESLSRGLVAAHPDDAARLLERHPVEAIVRVVQDSPPRGAAVLLDHLSAETAAAVLESVEGEVLARVLREADPARVAALLARFDEPARRARLACVDTATAGEIENLLTYPADTAGALMDPRVTTLRTDETAATALERIRAQRTRRTDAVFLVDAEGRLEGVVPIGDLARARPEERLGALARAVVVAAQAMDAREDVVERLGQTPLSILPVIDLEGRLLGAIRHGALVKVVEEEATAGLQTMVGASKEERALSKVSFAVRKRLPWLQINLVTAFLAAAVVGLFENTIARFTALAVLLPVVAGQSGNTGAQALAVTMRGLALREIRLRHWMVVAWKETRVAFVNGVAVALTTALGVYLWSRSLGLALVIGISMVISMVAAGLSGAGIPMLLTALRQDPAQSSSIVLTTVTDVVGFLSFLGIATLLAATL